MIDITHKTNTLKLATAEAVVKVGSYDTMEAIKKNEIAQGDIFETSKAAGLLGVKRTSELLPNFHAAAIEYASVEYEVSEKEICIFFTVKSICKSDLSVVAMHGASVVALNICEMLKSMDQDVEIGAIRVIKQKGAKPFKPVRLEGVSVDIVVCSNPVLNGEKEDTAGKAVRNKLMAFGLTDFKYAVVASDADKIEKRLLSSTASLIIFVGGTGTAAKDITPDTIVPLLDMRLSGVEETMRRYGQDRMPYAMLSRTVAGVKDERVVLAVPGSTNGASEAIDAVFPGVFHLFQVMKRGREELKEKKSGQEPWEDGVGA